MKLSDVQKRLQAPFPAHMVAWKPGVISKDRKRALMLAHERVHLRPWEIAGFGLMGVISGAFKRAVRPSAPAASRPLA